MTEAGSTPTTVKVGTGIGLALGGIAYFLSLFNYGSNPLRTATTPGYWSNLYDIQARALIEGQLAVPTGSLGIEGIVHDGQTHMYFPLFPALLRLPVLLTTHEYDGKLTLISMGLAWVLFAVTTTRLFWLVRRVVIGDDEPNRMHAAFGAAFIAVATGGTTLTFDAALPWVYHEAYVWAAAAAVGAMYWMIRVLTDGDTMSVRWLGGFVLLAVLTRPTEGWAVGLVTLSIGAWVATGRARVVDRRMWWQLLLAGLLPLTVGVVISEIKFGSFYLHPLTEQVWTTLSEHRRDALEANGGSLTGPQFFTTGLMAYFRPDGIRFVEYFPWVTLPADPAPAYSGAVIDQSYRTGSVTAFMPLLLFLTVIAALALLRPRARQTDRKLLVPLVAGILITGGVMGYGYYAMRYVTDFVPPLVIGGAVGTSLLLRWLDGHRGLAIGTLAVVSLGAVFSILTHVAVAYPAAAISAAGPDLRAYVGHQVSVSGGALASRVRRSNTVPVHGQSTETDDLVVVGDCDGLYLNTGDAYRPWATVATRDLIITLPPDEAFASGIVPIFETSAGARGSLETTADGRARVTLTSPGTSTSIKGEWHLLTGIGLRITVENATELEFFRVSSTPGGQIGGLPSTARDAEFNYSPVAVFPAMDLEQTAVATGLQVVHSWSAAPKICRAVEHLR